MLSAGDKMICGMASERVDKSRWSDAELCLDTRNGRVTLASRVIDGRGRTIKGTERIRTWQNVDEFLRDAKVGNGAALRRELLGVEVAAMSSFVSVQARRFGNVEQYTGPKRAASPKSGRAK